MESALAVRAGSAVTAKGNRTISTGSIGGMSSVAGKDAAAGTWSGGSPDDYRDLFSDIPSPTAIATMANTTVRKAGAPATRYYRRRLGWWATPERIVVTSSEQPLVKLSSGKMLPDGAWTPEESKHYLPIGVVRHRVGKVSVDSTRETTSGNSTEPMAKTGFEKNHADALDSIKYLPAPVRDSIMNRIPNPIVFEAQALKHSQNGGYWTVEVLKLDDEQALVVIATRVVGYDFWTVEQRIYPLAAKTDFEISGNKTKRVIGK